jgi:mono/diheme cytochrome c family protein
MALLYIDCTSGSEQMFDTKWDHLPGRFNLKSKISSLNLISFLSILLVTGCDVQRRQTDAQLGLNSQQSAGRRIYDQYCDRCHAPYSSRSRQGPSMQGVFKNRYLSLSGLPANDERVSEIIRAGRGKMHGYSQVLSQQQIENLLTYLHTL